MEYQNIINLLAYTPKQSPKFRKKSWVKVNDASSGTYKTNSYIKFRTIKLKSSLFLYMYIYIYIYICIYIFVKGTASITKAAAARAAPNNVNKN